MPWDGSGNFTLTQNFPNDYALGSPYNIIDPTKFNTEFVNIATGLVNCVARDGQNTPLGDLPMGTHKFTNLGAGTADAHAAVCSQVVGGKASFIGTFGGSDANTLTATLNPPPSALSAGLRVRGYVSATNTTAMTLNINALGVKTVYQTDGSTAIVANTCLNGRAYEFEYDGTAFRLQNSPTPDQLNASIATVSTAAAAASTAAAAAQTTANSAIFASTTGIVFYQSAAPTGWTAITASDYALRVVNSGSGGGSLVAGAAFTTVFTSTRTATGTVDGHALSIGEMPPHTHPITGGYGGAGTNNPDVTGVGSAYSANTGSAGSGSAHTHTFTSNNMNFAVSYANVIICTKN